MYSHCNDGDKAMLKTGAWIEDWQDAPYLEGELRAKAEKRICKAAKKPNGYSGMHHYTDKETIKSLIRERCTNYVALEIQATMRLERPLAVREYVAEWQLFLSRWQAQQAQIVYNITVLRPGQRKVQFAPRPKKAYISHVCITPMQNALPDLRGYTAPTSARGLRRLEKKLLAAKIAKSLG